jgi:purine-cytosine permease-like protein
MFSYTYAGLFFPTVPLMVLGAAIGGATPNVPSWSEGYANFSVGGVLMAMLTPAGGFGKFVAVLLALSLVGNLAAAMYSISLNFQLLLPFFVRVPRMVFTVVYTVVVIPVAISAAKSFFASLENFIYLIGESFPRPLVVKYCTVIIILITPFCNSLLVGCFCLRGRHRAFGLP